MVALCLWYVPETGEPPKGWYAYDHRNPVGSYVTYVDVTNEMLSKHLILHFGGVHSAMYVWINGQKVGYSQNSMSPAEFDVTKYLREGRNKLAVEVYRWRHDARAAYIPHRSSKVMVS